MSSSYEKFYHAITLRLISLTQDSWPGDTPVALNQYLQGFNYLFSKKGQNGDFTNLEPLFLTAFIYIKRLTAAERAPLLRRGIESVFATAFLLAVKYLIDFECPIAYQSRLTQLSPQQLVELEKDFLFDINYDLFVSAAEYDEEAAKINLIMGRLKDEFGDNFYFFHSTEQLQELKNAALNIESDDLPHLKFKR